MLRNYMDNMDKEREDEKESDKEEVSDAEKLVEMYHMMEPEDQKKLMSMAEELCYPEGEYEDKKESMPSKSPAIVIAFGKK